MSTTKDQGGSSGTPQGSERPLWSFPADGNSEWGNPQEIPAWAKSDAAFEAPAAEEAPGPAEPKKAFGERQGFAGRGGQRAGGFGSKSSGFGSKSSGFGSKSSNFGSKSSRSRSSYKDNSYGSSNTRTKREKPQTEPVELSDEQWASKGRAILLRQLTASSKSRSQLRKKLMEKEVPENIAEELLDRFEEIQLVDDESFAEAWVRSRARSKGLARSAIRRELRDKGIEGDMAETALEQLDDESEESTAKDLVVRKLRAPSMAVDKEKSVRRLVGMLARKGYSPSVAFRIVNEAWDEQFSEESY